MIIRSFSFLIALSFLSACVPNTEISPMPKGYAHLDATPVSSPHGYRIDPVRDDRIKAQREDNTNDWDAAATDLVSRLSAVLTSRPSEIAVVPIKSFAPTSGAFDFALRNALTDQGFIVSPDARAPTVLKYDAQITPNSRLKEDAFLDLSVRVSDNRRDFAEVKGTYKIRYQDVEIAKLPGFSNQPQAGIAVQPPRRMLNK